MDFIEYKKALRKVRLNQIQFAALVGYHYQTFQQAYKREGKPLPAWVPIVLWAIEHGYPLPDAALNASLEYYQKYARAYTRAGMRRRHRAGQSWGPSEGQG